MTQKAFDEWWDSNRKTLSPSNPCMTDSFEYWAWEGWHAALALTSTKCEVQPEQEPRNIAALVEGMEVSIDVSTGEHDSGNRLFGTVTLAQENKGSKHGLILLVQDPEPNFKQQRPWVELEGQEIRNLWEEATKPDRSTMTMVTSFAQAIEAALRSKNT